MTIQEPVPAKASVAQARTRKGPLRAAVLLLSAVSGAASASPGSGTFELNEASIAEIRSAVLNRKVSCQAIVAAYIERIEAYDNLGSKPIKSIIAINPQAMQDAKRIDDRKSNGNLGPLACAPLIVKDNINVRGMPTTAGSNALKGSMPIADATQIDRLLRAGAIVLAKSNLAEFAWTPDYSESSYGGLTRNPYDLDRTPGGSSGGTAAAVAANFGVGGLGTDTGASIRGPSALQNLVGLRPTMGASSRAGHG